MQGTVETAARITKDPNAQREGSRAKGANSPSTQRQLPDFAQLRTYLGYESRRVRSATDPGDAPHGRLSNPDGETPRRRRSTQASTVRPRTTKRK